MEYKVIKLFNNVEIIGKVFYHSGDILELEYPMVLILKEDGDNIYYKIEPYTYYSKQVQFNARHIIFNGSPTPSVIKLYEKFLEKTLTNEEDIILEDDVSKDDIPETTSSEKKLH